MFYEKILLSVFIILFLVILGVFYLINPNDPHYKSYYKEKAAYVALKNRDIDTFIKYMDNPVTIKHHLPMQLYDALIDISEYDRAIETINAHEKEINYGACAKYGWRGKLACRIGEKLFRTEMDTKGVQNIYLYKAYFEKGDFENALKHTSDGCLKAQAYLGMNDNQKSKKHLDKCSSSSQSYIQTLAYLLKQNKEYTKAIEEYSKTINGRNCNNDYCIKSYYGLANCYKNLGNNELAKKYYHKILEIKPYYYKAKKDLAELN